MSLLGGLYALRALRVRTASCIVLLLCVGKSDGLCAAQWYRMNPANEIFEHVDNVVVDQLTAIVPNSILDSRNYYWPNFVEPRFIYHERYKFIYSFQLPTLTESRDYYVASFGESLLVT